MNKRQRKKLRKRLGVWHYRVFKTACEYYVKLTHNPFPIKWWVMRTAIDLARHPEKFNEPFTFQRFARSLTAQTVLKSEETADCAIVNRYPEWLQNYLDHKRWKDGLNDDAYDGDDIDILYLKSKGDDTIEQTTKEETQET